ncbi:hypothetical protein [Ruminococcus sp. FC2018]|uniref:hypothetical protein n=1 Tax=Ruminococcus sp. FC2018 TaxID=1410617 RepID=UPI00048ABB58|nr:hypothetical protein [Ruminococcus sp. FC2018]
MKILDMEFTGAPVPAEAYKQFVQQLSGWYGGGEMPQLASQDLRFALELQKQKMNSLGLGMQCAMKGSSGTDKNNAVGISYSDRVFANSIVSGNLNMTRSIGSKQYQAYKDTNEIGLTAVIQDLKGGTQPDKSMPLCCPHCGAASTLGELEDGCEYCGTKFVMSELYPKVSNFFITRHEDRTDRYNKNKREAAIFMAACIIPLIIMSFILGDQLVMRIIAAFFAGGIVGFILFCMKKLFETFVLIGKTARGGSGTVTTLYRLNKIKKHDPEFSGEYFRDKAIALFRMAVYSSDPTQLACCKCECPEKAADIIEADIYNLNVNSCEINGDVCEVQTTLFLDCLHFNKKGKIVLKCDKFRMSMRKRLKKATELGFSMRAVSCPSCGASFDAYNVKECPYCRTPYELEDDDWVMTALY